MNSYQNQSVLCTSRTKHIGVRYHGVRGEIEHVALDARFVPTDYDVAGILKSLPKSPFQRFRDMFGNNKSLGVQVL